jgi:hypothetical protein
MKKVFYLLSAGVIIILGMTMPQVVTANLYPHDVVVGQEVNYQEIPKENVPQTVTESLEKDYSGYQIDKAYLGDDGSYKLDVSQADVKYTIYYKENGELIKVEEPASEKVEEGVQELQKDVKDTIPEMN